MLRLRKRLQREYEAAFSVNDVIIRSAALALRDVPEVRLCVHIHFFGVAVWK